MLIHDVAKRYTAGREQGRRFMLVCQDVFDYHRGDSDLGYYYVYCDRPEDVADRLGALVFAPDWDGLTDRCHAVVPLDGPSDPAFDESLCVAPGRWLAQYRAA